MDILKISVQKGTRIRRSTLEQAAAAPNIAATWWELLALLPSRNQTDTIRVALAYKLRAWQKFEASNGDQCKALATPTKGSKGLDIRVHVQRRGADRVAYSDLVLSYTGGNGEAPVCTLAPEAAQYPDLVADLGDLAALQAFGEAHWFDNDLRFLAQSLLEQATMPLWPGVMLLLDSAARASVANVEQLLEKTQDGAVTIRLLSLDNTPANREALARELGEHLEEQAQQILEATGYDAPNVKRCTKLYQDLAAKVDHAEALLEVQIPDIWTTLAQIEMALEALHGDPA